MLVIKIELWPKGDSSKARLLHTGWIGSDGTGSKTKGNYRFGLSQRNRLRTVLRKGNIENFPRKRLSAWDLLYRCLREAFGERNE